MTPEERQEIIRRLEAGEELSPEWARVLFPPEKREYELVYHGKQREEDVLADTLAVPLQAVRTFGKNGGGAWHNMLIFGDNLQVMKSLLQMKKAGQLCNADGTPGVRLVYIDPPFATRRDFQGTQDQQAYQDKVEGARFVEFLRKRLIFLRELLADDGSLFLHLDVRKCHYLKTVLDEVFGEHLFQAEIIWKCSSAHSDAKAISAIHQNLFFYSRSPAYLYNPQYQDYDQAYVKSKYRHVDEKGRRYRLDNLTATGLKGGGYKYKWRGVTKIWRCPVETMRELERQGRIRYTKHGTAEYIRYLDEMPGLALQDLWSDINPVNSQAVERIDYPTQKPEALLVRIVNACSQPGDIVMDAFAGSGTACAVAEKLNRRWLAIDCGKLAIYKMQKRLLNLRKEIGNTGPKLDCKPFTLHNAGLYDFSTLKTLSWPDWRFFALQLFGCKDEPHTIGGLTLDGKLKGASVLVFNHHENPGKRIDEETIQDIHAAVGKKIGRKFFVIAPRGVFDFQQDYIDLEGVRYYALRIPYSIINELHHRDFTALKQPSDETAVNETVDAVGFDFIRPPKVDWSVGVSKRKGKLLEEVFLKVKKFQSYARLRGEETHGGLESFSMLMLDFDYDGEVFDLDAVFYAHQLEEADWEAWFPVEPLGPQVMAVFIDIHGNEAKEVIAREKIGVRAGKAARKTPKAVKV